jgi:hypothetical protein
MNENLGHLMLDLETMGNRAGCAIVSIGAVEFNLETGKLGREFYERVYLQSCLDAGLFVQGGTIYWWLGQSEAARKQICMPSENLSNVLEKFKSFTACLGDFCLWGNGARFDIGILEAAYHAIGRGEVLPWKFRNERDVRTLVAFAPSIKENYPFTGVEHNPIDDCKHQIAYSHAIWRYFNDK